MSGQGGAQGPIPKNVTYVCSSCGNEIRVDIVNGRLPATMRCEKCGAVFPIEAQSGATPNAQMQWTPGDVDRTLKTVDGMLNGLGEKFVTYKRDEAQADNQFLKTAGAHNRQLLVSLLIFLGGLVVLMGYLAALKVVSGDALLFLAGTITGYLIVLVQRLIQWTDPERPKPEA